MGKLTPEAVIRTHQIFRYDDVRNMVERHGFSVREGNGTSHVVVTHPEHTDITFTLNRSPGRIRDYQHDAAKACLEVIDRDLAQESDISEAHENITEFPDDISVRTKGSTLILRDKKHPCIGIAIAYDKDKNGLADIANEQATTIRNKVRELSDLLASAREEYGIMIREEDRHICLEFPKPDEDGTTESILAPYNILSNEDPLKIVADVITMAEQELTTSNKFWHYLETNSMFSGFKKDTKSENPHVTFTVKNRFTKNRKTITAPITRYGVIEDTEQVKAIFEIVSHLFEPGTFKELKEGYGIVVKGRDNQELRLVQPILDMESDPLKNPRRVLQNISKTFMDSVDPEEQEQLARDHEWVEEAGITWSEIAAFADIVHERALEGRAKMIELRKRLDSLGVNVNVDRKLKFGQPYRNIITTEADRSLVFSYPGLRIKMGRIEQEIVPPGKMDEIHRFLDKVDGKLKQDRKTTLPQGTLAVLANPFESQESLAPTTLEEALKFNM